MKELGDFHNQHSGNLAEDDWMLTYDDYAPELEGRREALCALGNGYFVTRGAGAECSADGIHYPATYVCGLYNRLLSTVGGRCTEREDLVNVTNWLPLTFRLPDSPWFALGDIQILQYRQTLNLKDGILSRTVVFRDRDRTTKLSERRFVHMRYCHLAGVELELTPIDWCGPIDFKVRLDGGVRNMNTLASRTFNNKHVRLVESDIKSDVLYLKIETTQSNVQVSTAARVRVAVGGKPVEVSRNNNIDDDSVAQTFQVFAEMGKPVAVEKIAAIFTSRDAGISESGLSAQEEVLNAQSFEKLLAEQAESWRHLWQRFDLQLDTVTKDGTMRVPLMLRLHSFHVLQTVSLNSIDSDIGVPARGWTGEGYQGHIFWDDLFVFPFLNLRTPEITRSLLHYRWRRLNKARQLALALKASGARYPWQSGSSGREETPDSWDANKQRWIPDYSHLQIHVSAAVAYNVWQYFQVTGDLGFMQAHGADMLFEIARFFTTFAQYNPDRDRYEIRGVVGPDEYHVAYPGAATPGINNNAYTNLIAVWTLCRALDLLQLLPADPRREICERLKLDEDELADWEQVSRKMFVPLGTDGIIEQFEGYESLEDFPWRQNNYLNVEELERILREQDGNLNQYKVSKQADVLMLFYLFSTEELAELFERLGYQLRGEMIPKNIEHYIRQTANNSTLSRVVHAWVLSRLNRQHAWHLLCCSCPPGYGLAATKPNSQPPSWHVFLEALGSDLLDIQGGTTAEGIHMGAMAGTLDIIQRCYSGIVTRGNVLWLNPRLPDSLESLQLNVRYQNQSLSILITQSIVSVSASYSSAKPVLIGFKNNTYRLDAGETKRFDMAVGYLCE